MTTTTVTVGPEMIGAYAFVEAVTARADARAGPYPLWHGWALREAYLAGHAAAAAAERVRCAGAALAAAERWPDDPHMRSVLRSLAAGVAEGR